MVCNQSILLLYNNVKRFVKQVMQPATGKTADSIVKRFPVNHFVRTGYSWHEIEEPGMKKAITDFPDKIDVDVAKEKIAQLEQSFYKSQAREMELDMKGRGHTAEERGQAAKVKLEQMRIDIKKEREVKEKEKKEKNIKRLQKERQQEAGASDAPKMDMPID